MESVFCNLLPLFNFALAAMSAALAAVSAVVVVFTNSVAAVSLLWAEAKSVVAVV